MYIDPLETNEMSKVALARRYPEVYNKLCEVPESEPIALKQGLKRIFEIVVLFKNWLRNLLLRK